MSITKVWPEKHTYTAYEPILVNFEGFPGSKWDWITIVAPDAPDGAFGDVLYTNGRKSGTLKFGGLREGIYEIRGVHGGSDGKFIVRARQKFTVMPGNGATQKSQTMKRLAWPLKDVYKAGEIVVVEFKGMPGNDQDWITVVPADSPAETYHQWYYLKGKKDGFLTFTNLKPGSYEVRVFFNWPEGGYNIRDKYQFRVVPAPSQGKK